MKTLLKEVLKDKNTDEINDINKAIKAANKIKLEDRLNRQNNLKKVSDIHTIKKLSLFDSEVTIVPNYRGFINLCFLLLCVIVLRLIIENFLKYGVLFLDLKNLIFNVEWYCIFFLLILPIFPFISYSIEYIRYKTKIDVITWLHIINIMFSILIPIYIILTNNNRNFLDALSLLFPSFILSLKLISYAHVFYVDRNNHQKLCNYSLKHMIYFIFAPTLCYQHSYPRYPKNNIRIIYIKTFI